MSGLARAEVRRFLPRTVTMLLEPGTTLLSRYRLDEALGGSLADTFAGTDQQTGQRIFAFSLPAADVLHARAAARVPHQHLAKVLELVDDDGGAIVVTEHIAGLRLDERLAHIGKKHSVDAVRSALRIADALAHLHAEGAVHGGLRPAAVVVEPEGHPAPMVRFLPPTAGPYQSPDRGQAPASEADDAWAAAGLLFLMLTGKPPPPAGIASDAEVRDAGVEDEALRAALVHGLARDPQARSSDLKPLKRELARWFVEHAADEGSGSPATLPPPLPPASAPAVSSNSRPAVRPAKRRPLALLAVAGIAFGLATAWAVSSMRRKPDVQVVATPAPARSAGPPQIALSEVPVTGETDALVADNKMLSCVAGFLPKATFGKSLSMDWVCTEADAREGGARLRSAIVAGAPPREMPTTTMKLFSQMAAYDMAAFAVIRAGCCADAAPLKLPEGSPECPDMAAALLDLGAAVTSGGLGKDEPLERFTQGLTCEVNARHAGLFNLKGRPHANEKEAFLKLIEQIQQP